MKYVQPYGIADEDAPYINGDPSQGRMGSIPPAAAFEHPMRELVELITFNKFDPSDLDLAQVATGVRSQRSNYVEDTGWVNNLSVALDPPLREYTIGMPLRVKVYATNTGPSNIDAGVGRVSIRKPTGAEVGAGDLPAAGIIELVYDGASFQMVNFGGSGAGGADNTFLVNVPYTVDTGTVNKVVANFSPAIADLVAGSMIMVKIANTNMTFATINVNGMGEIPLYAQGCSVAYPMLPCDINAGDVLIFTYDGTHFWFYASGSINKNASFNVANNTQINELFVALGRKRILANAYVNIQMAIGVYSPFITYHPDAQQIQVTGTMKAAMPTFAEFYKTGNSAAARAQDSANNLAMLRTRFGTEVHFPIEFIGSAIQHTGPGQITFHSILVTGANQSGAATGRGGLSLGFGVAADRMQCINCAVHGAQANGFAANVNGYLSAINCFAVGCFEAGFLSYAGSTLVTSACGAYGNLYSGFAATIRAVLHCYARTGATGIPDVAGCQSIFNGNWETTADIGSLITMYLANFSGNGQFDVRSYDMSGVNVTTSTVPTTSPAWFTVGNYNSINVAT